MLEKTQLKTLLDERSLFTDNLKKANTLTLQCEKCASAGNLIKINGPVDAGTIIVPVTKLTPIEILAKNLSKGVALVWINTATLIQRFSLSMNVDVVLPKRGTSLVTYYLVFSPNFESHQLWSQYFISKTNILNSLGRALYGRAHYFTLVGYNYTAFFQDHTLFLKLGFSHICSVYIPHGVFIKIINKRQISLYGINTVNLQKVAIQIHSLKKPSVFTGKGLIPGKNPKKFKIKKRSGQ